MEFTTVWSDWVALAAILVQVLIAIFGGTASTNVTNFLKQRWGWEGTEALILSYAVSVLAGALLAVSTGLLAPELFANPVAIATVLITTILANERSYQAQKAATVKFQD